MNRFGDTPEGMADAMEFLRILKSINTETVISMKASNPIVMRAYQEIVENGS